MNFGARLRHAWNAFQDVVQYPPVMDGGTYTSGRADRVRLNFSNEKSIISSIFTRIAIDVASIDFRHVRLDDKDRYLEDIDSGLNSCLSVETNIDQTPRAFKQDFVLSLFDKGCIAIVPIDTTENPTISGSYDIKTMRVAEIAQWYTRHVRVRVWNDLKGRKEEIILPKSMVAIVENPLYLVMNETNSTLQRLIRKLNLLDVVDEQSSSGKLDLIIQLPYIIKSDARRQQAEQRRKDIEFQLKGSQYGIAYTDGTEKITQLNRPAENNLLNQVKVLIEMLYSQLGLTPEVMNGTADERTMLNYHNRTIAPIADSLVEAMRRSFLTKTARTQGQTIMYFHDPFKFVTVGDIADIADKLSRNEILTGNEIRQIIKYRPSTDPKADELRNSNMPQPNNAPSVSPVAPNV